MTGNLSLEGMSSSSKAWRIIAAWAWVISPVIWLCDGYRVCLLPELLHACNRFVVPVAPLDNVIFVLSVSTHYLWTSDMFRSYWKDSRQTITQVFIDSFQCYHRCEKRHFGSSKWSTYLYFFLTFIGFLLDNYFCMKVIQI